MALLWFDWYVAYFTEKLLSEVAVLRIELRSEECDGGGGTRRGAMLDTTYELASVDAEDEADRVGRTIGDGGVDRASTFGGGGRGTGGFLTVVPVEDKDGRWGNLGG